MSIENSARLLIQLGDVAVLFKNNWSDIFVLGSSTLKSGNMNTRIN